MEIYKMEKWWFKKYDGRRKEFKGLTKQAFEEARDKHILRYWRSEFAAVRSEATPRAAYSRAKHYNNEELKSYRKIVAIDSGHVWLISPVYKWSDYNKSTILRADKYPRTAMWLAKKFGR